MGRHSSLAQFFRRIAGTPSGPLAELEGILLIAVIISSSLMSKCVVPEDAALKVAGKKDL